MPFDATELPPAADAAADPHALHRRRREEAAALWRAVPREDFNMGQWRCGTTACALGWLAHEKHDGWRWYADVIPVRGCPFHAELEGPFRAAAHYFGLSHDEADALFGGSGGRYGRAFCHHVTPNDVAEALLAAPYAAVDAE